MNKKGYQGFGIIGVLAIVIVVAIVGAAGWYVFDKQKNNESDVDSSKTSQDTKSESKSKTADSTTTTVKSVLNSGTTVAIKHPSSWTVSNTTVDFDNAGTKATRAYVKSAKGNYLHIRDNGGVGGDCESNNDTFTLVKRFATQSSEYYFAEYKYNDSSASPRYLSLENHKNGENWTTLKEGETGTDTCSNMPQYTFAGKLYVSITKSETASLVSSVSYDDLVKNDPEFIDMLKSMTVTE